MELQDEVELIEFIPKACEGSPEAPAHYEGKITLEAPMFEDRLAIIEALSDLGFQEEKSPEEMSPEEKIALGKKRFKQLIAMMKLARPWIRAVNIKRLADGKVYTSMDQLSRISDFDADLPLIVQSLAQSGLLQSKPTPS